MSVIILCPFPNCTHEAMFFINTREIKYIAHDHVLKSKQQSNSVTNAVQKKHSSSKSCECVNCKNSSKFPASFGVWPVDPICFMNGPDGGLGSAVGIPGPGMLFM